jgi:hypothetical protein
MALPKGTLPCPMKKEKVILSFVAALVGIAVAGLGFFFYQSSKKIDSSEVKKITITNPSPTPVSSIFLTVDSPKDDEVVDKRTITISGKTIPEAKIIILTQGSEAAAVAAGNGDFNTDITLEDNENIIEISAFAPNGEIAKVKRVVIYSTESF